jgi:transglutaminase-like putative cysteine protease
MRLRIAHSIVHRYDPPATGVIQVLRLTPRNHDGQYVIGWRIDVSGDARLNAHDDAFGNLTHVYAADGPLAELSIRVDGEVETQNADGVVRGSLERFPPSLFLRDTPLTEADAAIRDFALDIRAANGGNRLAELHALMHRLHDEMICENDPTRAPAATAAETFARKGGVTADLTHIFLGAARSMQIPARYVAGYVCGGEARPDSGGHAWVEAQVPGLGWVGFDAVSCVCPTDAYVRVAVGLDALGAAPVRGRRYGVGEESLAVAVRIDQ